MAARRASMQFFRTLQQSSGFLRSDTAMEQEATPLRAAVASLSQRQTAGSFSTRRLHSEAQAANDGHGTHEYESSKMTAEGGGTAEKNFSEKAEEVKESGAGKVKATANSASDKAEEVKEKASSVTDSVADQASKEVDTAKDMTSDLPQQVSETATGLKEVGVEAAKAVKRDAEKVAKKVGLKSE